jgi:hypothetical protein
MGKLNSAFEKADSHLYLYPPPTNKQTNRAGIFQILMSLGINSMESIPLAYVA